MLNQLVDYIAQEVRISRAEAAQAVGVLLNAADRQGAAFAQELFALLPGAREAADRAGAEMGAGAGVVARLIDRSPAGRAAMIEQAMRALHRQGLGSRQIGQLPRAIAGFVQARLGTAPDVTVGALFGGAPDVTDTRRQVA